MDVLDKHDYRVQTCPLSEAADLIVKHHYARGSANTAVFRHGLYHKDRGLVGAALWMPPTKVAGQSVSDDWKSVICLSRLVIVPGEPTNSASHLLGRSIRLIRQDGRYKTLLTYADERQGHTGRIYLATNWEYLGHKQGDPVYVDSDGRQVARKSAGNSRTHQEMLALGYVCLGRSVKHKYVKVIR